MSTFRERLSRGFADFWPHTLNRWRFILWVMPIAGFIAAVQDGKSAEWLHWQGLLFWAFWYLLLVAWTVRRRRKRHARQEAEITEGQRPADRAKESLWSRLQRGDYGAWTAAGLGAMVVLTTLGIIIRLLFD